MSQSEKQKRDSKCGKNSMPHSWFEDEGGQVKRNAGGLKMPGNGFSLRASKYHSRPVSFLILTLGSEKSKLPDF